MDPTGGDDCPSPRGRRGCQGFTTNTVLDERCSYRYSLGMHDKTRREIIGRRTRPAKAPLSRDIIISTALGILESDGLSGLSLRRVATALDTGAASLYVYLANLDELYSLMLDQALAAVELPRALDQPWRVRLKTYLVSYFRVLTERQGLAQLAMSTIATGSNALRMWEVLLGLLKEGGVEEARLVWGVDFVLLYVTAVAAEQANWRATGQDFGRVKRALSAVPAEQFPLVSALFQGERLSGMGDGDARLEWALDSIIDGIKTKHMPLRHING
jgi:AcrR family transcriptional regulator